MTFTRDLGTFSSLQAVWEAYPSGGQTGDYLNVNGRIYGWDATSQNWVMWTQPQQSARSAQTVNGDLNVGNNLHVGGILDAKVVRGRDAFQGLFNSVGELNSKRPNPLVGQWALVMLAERQVGSLALGEVYYCEADGTWTDAGYESDVAGIINQLLAETTARQTADQELQENIDEVAGNLSDEATTRQQADTALGGRIDDEATARGNADTALNDLVTEKDYAVITDAEMDEVLAEE